MKVNIGNYPNKGKERVIKVKIDPWDTFSMDHTLALIIHPLLIEFRKVNNGWPGEIASMEEWEKIVDKMIYAFEKMLESENESYIHTMEEEPFIKEGLELFGKYFRALWT